MSVCEDVSKDFSLGRLTVTVNSTILCAWISECTKRRAVSRAPGFFSLSPHSMGSQICEGGGTLRSATPTTKRGHHAQPRLSIAGSALGYDGMVFSDLASLSGVNQKAVEDTPWDSRVDLGCALASYSHCHLAF